MILEFIFSALVVKVTAQQGVRFEREAIDVGGKKLVVEVADDERKREQGLMFRTELADGRGMLFVFPNAQVRAFWMKNTLIPLSIGFFDAKMQLIDIQEMEPASVVDQKPKTYPSKMPAQYALEAPKGWFKRNKISLSAKLTRPRH